MLGHKMSIGGLARPPGCYRMSHALIPTLLLNPSMRNAGSCTTSYECLCFVAKRCLYDSGKQKNPGPCICGKRACTGLSTGSPNGASAETIALKGMLRGSLAGLYCYGRGSHCSEHPIPVCAEGNATTSPPCFCGTASCLRAGGVCDTTNKMFDGVCTYPSACPLQDGFHAPEIDLNGSTCMPVVPASRISPGPFAGYDGTGHYVEGQDGTSICGVGEDAPCSGDLFLRNGGVDGGSPHAPNGGSHSADLRLFVVRKGATLKLHQMNLSRGVSYEVEGRGCSLQGTVCGGGLVHATGAGTRVEASECVFEAGIAAHSQIGGSFGGGAIYATFGATVVLNNSIVRGNLAAQSGGGIMMFDESTLFLKKSTIERNWAASIGGGLVGSSAAPYNAPRSIKIVDSTLKFNFVGSLDLTSLESGSGGGAAFRFCRAVNFTNSSVYGNLAYSNGGGVTLADRSVVHLRGTSIRENVAGPESIKATNTSSLYTKNILQSSNGGGLYLEGGACATMSDGFNTISNNAARDGRSIFVQAGFIYFEACPPGRFGLTDCAATEEDIFGCGNKCPAGKFASSWGPRSSSDNCTLCPAGYTQNTVGQSACPACPTGFYAETEAQIRCNGCSSGKFSSAPGTSSDCTPCPIGFVGLKGKNRSSCSKCPVGWSSVNGTESCQPCGLGKYTENVGSECRECPSGFFQEQSSMPSVACKVCPHGFGPVHASNIASTGLVGQTFCTDLNWASKESCKDTEYLDDRSDDGSLWNCTTCPDGAFCEGPVNRSEVVPKFGYARCHGKDIKFERCSFSPACLGARNDALLNKFLDANGHDMALAVSFPSDTGCNDAYLNDSRICAAW
jgi:hypothetical protein